MAFPRELRQAIPDLHAGRVLEIDSVSGQATNLFEPLVELRIQVKETGKLKGKYLIAVALQSDAARKLAATLVELADQIDKF
jgi:hypothetical protein